MYTINLYYWNTTTICFYIGVSYKIALEKQIAWLKAPSYLSNSARAKKVKCAAIHIFKFHFYLLKIKVHTSNYVKRILQWYQIQTQLCGAQVNISLKTEILRLLKTANISNQWYTAQRQKLAKKKKKKSLANKGEKDKHELELGHRIDRVWLRNQCSLTGEIGTEHLPF